MNPSRLRLYRAGRLLASVLLATGLFAAAAHADDSVQALTIGTTVHGEITSADRLNYIDGTHSKLYRFNGKAGEVLSFQASGELGLQLAVYTADGGLQTSSYRDCEEEEHASTQVKYLVESDQTYVLAVSGIFEHTYGSFQITSERMEWYNGGTLTPDVTVVVMLNDSPREIPLMIGAAGVYQIDLRPSMLDTEFELSGNGVLQSNSGRNDDSWLLAQLQPGRYTLTARGDDDRERSPYALRVTA